MKFIQFTKGLCYRTWGPLFVFLLLLYPFIAYAEEDFAETLGLKESTINLLRIAYVSGTKGELYPCPTCGKALFGGLAKRSGLFKELRKDPTPLIIIEGPEEFLSDADILRLNGTIKYSWAAKRTEEDPQRAKKLLLAHNILSPDIGWISNFESEWLKKHTGELPKNFYTIDKKPIVKVINSSLGKIGIVFFPQGTEKFGAPSQQQIQETLSAGKQLLEKTRFVIGISPWGSVFEKRFIPSGDGIFSCLLGGGNGLSFSYSPEDSTNTLLWVRSEGQGRAVNLINIKELASQGRPEWKEGLTFSAKQIFLNAHTAIDPAMEKIIGTNLISITQ